MSRVVLTATAISIFTLSFVCNNPDKNSSLQSSVREAIDRYNKLLQDAYVRADVNTITGLMTDSVAISPIGFPDLIGRDSIRNLLTGFFQGNSVAKYELHLVELEVYADVAYDRGTFVWESSSRNGSKLNSIGRYSAVRHKGEDGLWRIHRLIENQLPDTK